MAGHLHNHLLPLGECDRGACANFQDLPDDLELVTWTPGSLQNEIAIFDESSDKGEIGELVLFSKSNSCVTADTITTKEYSPLCTLKATIPWILRRSKLKKMSQEKKSVLDVVRKNTNLPLTTALQLRELLSSLQDMAPYYLHKRYHTMDCLSLFQHTKSTGNYWPNAVQFTIMNATMGVKTLKSFDTHLKEYHQIQEHPKLVDSNFLKNEFFETLNNVEDCKSAEEFLLEPWILLQLPFEPVILHQWTVALMAEALRFQKKITDFTTMAYPEHLKSAVNKLTTIASLLLNGANTFLSFVAKSTSGEIEETNHMHEAAELHWKKFQEVLPQVLSALKFVLSEDCGTMISTLKCMAWSENADERTCRSNIDFKFIPSIYSHTYWELHQLHKWLFLSQETSSEQLINDFHLLASAPIKRFRNLKESVVKMVEEQIIKPGRLMGEQSEDILKIAAENSFKLETFCNQYDDYVVLTECAVFGAGKGVIYNILTLQAEVKTEEAIGSITQRLADLVKQEFPNSKIFINSSYSAAQEMKLDEMEKKINKVFLSSNWNYKKLIRQRRATCFSPKRMPLPDRVEMTTEQIAEHFQERIRNLVFKMIEKQYRSLMNGPPYYYHPEIIAVQYFLPCFAASYLEMESTNESDQAKEEYLQFVHQLIKNYEQHEFCLELGKVKLKQEYFNHHKNFQFCFYKEIEQNYDDACEVLGAIAPFCRKNVVQKGLAHIHAVIRQPSVFCECLHKTGERAVSDDTFFYLKQMIFKRIHATLEKLGKIPSVRYSAALSIVLKNLNENALALQPNLQNFISVLNVRENLINANASGNLCCQQNASQAMTKMYHEFNRLSDKQLFSLVHFVCFQEWFVGNKNFMHTKDFERDYGRQIFPLDLIGKLFWCIVDKDWWKLKILASKSNINKQGDDLSLIPLGLAKSLKRCRDLINAIDQKTGKLRTMKEPGAITFFPIKHCRWCGLVKSNTLKLCRECVENLNYPDRNYFCSVECETKCLQHQHTEEHVNFLLMQLNT